MQKEHRDSIQRNFSSLVEQTDLDLMVAALYEKGVFSDSMIEPYKDTNKNTRSRKRQLYRDITRRGPEAFRSLLDALSENGYWDLVRDLDPNSSLHTRNRTTPNQAGGNSFLSIKKSKTGRDHNDVNRNRATPSTSINRNASGTTTINTNTENGNNTSAVETGGNRAGTEQVPIPQFNVIKSTKFFEDDGSDIKLYRTRGRFRGVLVLFSYIAYVGDIDRFRRGAAVDSLNLRYLFTELGFKVFSYHNLSLKETRDTLSSLKEGDVGEGWPETMFIVVSSHGYPREGTGDYDLRCSDGGLISFYEIIEYFNNFNFPALYEVPKVFIFQSCRGSKEEYFSYSPPHMRAPRPARHTRHTVHDGSPSRAAGHARIVADARDVSDARADPPGSDETGAGDADNPRNRMYSDILIAHSTLPGYVSMRDPERGSWFIQALCDVFAARAHDTHVEDLFTLVDERLRQQYRVQTSSVDRWGFNRRLYLHPGMHVCED